MATLTAHLWHLSKRDNDQLLPDGTHPHPDHVNDMKRKVYLWVGIVDIFLFSVSTFLFVYRGRRTLDINAHAVLLTSIGSFTILVVNTCFLFQFVWPGHFPCFVILWCAYPGVMLWMSCTMARAMRLYILSFRNIQKLKERNKAGQMTAAQLYGKGAIQDSESDINGGEASETPQAGNGNEAGTKANNPSQMTGCRGVYRRMMAGISKWWAHEKMQITERRLVWYTLGATLFSAILCSFIQGFTKDLSIVPLRFSICPVGVWEYFPLYALIAMYCLVLTPIIVYHIWPIKDAFGIRHDILLNNLFTFVCIVMFMVQTNKGFGGKDPFWDSFLWCSLLFNLSQFTSVIFPLVKSYRQSDAFTWSDGGNRGASKELFYRVLNHPDLFEKLKVYSAANFCTEITLFLEEYQVLKANTVRFYNMGEPGFDDDEPAADGGDAATTKNTTLSDDNAASTRAVPLVPPTTGLSEKDTMRLRLNGHVTGPSGGSNPQDLESNPDTIISVKDDGSVSDIGAGNAGEYSDKAAMVPRQGAKSKMGGLLRAFKGGLLRTNNEENGGSSSNNQTSNTATLAVGGAAIGNLPERRNSRGEDMMVLSRIPPFTPVRYTILSTLMQTPAGLTRQANMSTFKTLPFALRGDYYGFYSTFIADGATLQINIDGKISEAITRLIHSQQYTVDMMDECHSEVLQLLYDNIFKKFVRLYHRDMANIV